MEKERRWRKKERTGCRSVGDYRHKAWVGATVNIRAISNDEDYHRHVVMMTIAITMLVIKAMVMKMLMKHSKLWWWGWSEPWIRARGTLDLNVDKRKRSWLGFSFCLTSYSDWKLRGWGEKNFFVIVGSVFKTDDQDIHLFAIFFAIRSLFCSDGGLKRSNYWYSSLQRYWPCLLLIQDGQSAFRFVHTRPRMVAKIHLCSYRSLWI